MSFQAMAWASEQTTGSCVRKAVLYAIANHANKDGECYLRVSTICDEAEMGDRAARLALVDLADMGLLDKERPRRADGTLGILHFTLPLPARNADGLPAADAVGPTAPHAASPAAADAAQEPVLDLDLNPVDQEQELDLDLAAPPRTRVERDLIWDALGAIFGAPLTRSAKTLRGRIVSSLLEAGATAEQIAASPEAYRARMPGGTTFTETALEKHWSLLLVPVENVKPAGPNMKYGQRDVSSEEFYALADRIEAEERRQLEVG